MNWNVLSPNYFNIIPSTYLNSPTLPTLLYSIIINLLLSSFSWIQLILIHFHCVLYVYLSSLDSFWCFLSSFFWLPVLSVGTQSLLCLLKVLVQYIVINLIYFGIGVEGDRLEDDFIIVLELVLNNGRDWRRLRLKALVLWLFRIRGCLGCLALGSYC